MKTEIVYSRADWKYHNDRLGYDDLIDAHGRFLATVNVMDLAVHEMLSADYVAGGTPREIFIHEADGHWSVYVAAQWLTPNIVQRTLNALGRLLKRKFVFEPYELPVKLSRRYEKEAARIVQISQQSTAWKTVVVGGLSHLAKKKKTKSVRPTIASRRLFALMSQKMKG